jgi:glycine cleavage system H protein
MQAQREQRLFSVSAACMFCFLLRIVDFWREIEGGNYVNERLMRIIVKVKKYTEDHEWIEMSEDGKTCTFTSKSPSIHIFQHSRFAIANRQPRLSSTPFHSFLRKQRPPLTPLPGTLGISVYAAKALGDVVYVELPELDMEVSEGDAIGAVESVKSASDILTPISGTVAEVNTDLEATPANINKDPEGASWIAKITVSEEPKGKTMSAEEYKTFTED